MVKQSKKIKPKCYPKIFSDLEAFINDRLKKDFPRQEQALNEKLACSVVRGLSDYTRGKECYFPVKNILNDLLNGKKPELFHQRVPHYMKHFYPSIDAINVRLKKDFPHLVDEHHKNTTYSAIRALSHYGGGKTFYMPMGTALKNLERDEQVFREFGRLTIEQLSIKHGRGQRAIYGAIARQRKRIKTNQQEGNI